MYHSRKIGVFISHIIGHYQKNVCQGIIDTASAYGYTTEIFTTMDGENLGNYGIGEQSIIDIPDYRDYSGIIFASDTYPAADLKAQILSALLAQHDCPVVEIAAQSAHFPAVALENNHMTTELVTHLSSAHNCKRICYLGSTAQPYFSDLRKAYYIEAMRAQKLFAAKEDIYCCAPTQNAVREAFAYFLSAGKLDAIVCYNDEMALFLMSEIAAHGYRIPKDIAVTGCDCTPEGQHIIPTLTSVTFPVYELGCRSVELLQTAMRAEVVPPCETVSANIFFGGSCGCAAGRNADSTDILTFQQSLNGRIASLERSILDSMHMSADFSGITDIDDGMDLLAQYIQKIEHCREFYLCLYEGWDFVSGSLHGAEEHAQTEAVSDTVLLKLALRDGKRLPECSFGRAVAYGLLPEHIYKKSDASYIYTPLFFGNRAFGYVALSCEKNRVDYHFRLVHYFMNINQMLHSIREAKYASLLAEHIEKNRTIDALTGLYNRRGFFARVGSFFADASDMQSTVVCFSFRLARLGTINATFGREEGDFAIQIIGQAIFCIRRPGDVFARLGNGEFALLTTCGSSADKSRSSVADTQKEADDLLARFLKYLENYNLLSTKNYSISASGGYACSVPLTAPTAADVDTLLAMADADRRLRLP